MTQPTSQAQELRRILQGAKDAAVGRRTAAAAAFRSIANAQPIRTEARDVVQSHISTAEYRSAWERYALHGERALNISQRSALAWGEVRDLSDTTGSGGAFTVPPAFEQRLSQVQTFASPVRQVATVLSTPDGRTLNWVSTDDSGQAAAMLTENAQKSEDFDPVFARISLRAYPFVALARFPRTLEQDVRSVYSTMGQFGVVNNGLRTPTPSASWGPNPAAPSSYTGISIEDVVAQMFGPRFARGENPYFTHGTGSSQPLGITACTVGATSVGPTAITFADLEAVWYSLDPAYQMNATWMIAPSTEKAIRALTDAAGVLLFPANQPLRIFGAPVVLNRDMTGLTASSVSVVVGDFSRGYVIRQVQATQVQRLDERYADTLEVGLVGAERVDGTLDDTAALRSLVQA